MECPHCGDETETLIRTGEKKYSCGECSMVIKYDEDVRPNLDSMEVIDKREDDDDEKENPDNSNSSQSPSTSTPPQNTSPQTEREIIRQRGRDGLKEIKKERLVEFLEVSDGVGGQTIQRIKMVMDRNETVHTDPNALFQLLDDELKASSTYINTMVQHVFEPEEEHGDLLMQQGYVPWTNRNNMGGGRQQQQMPSQSQQNSMGGRGPYNPQNTQQQTSSQNQGGQQNKDALSRDEAEMMVAQAVDNADQQERRMLADGLSEATDQAIQEAASNVGGLAGTIQDITEVALKEYARENPEWVIENMNFIQKIIGAIDDSPDGEQQQNTQAQEDQKVDSALTDIGEGNTQSQQTKSREAHNQDNSTEPKNPDIDPEEVDENNYTPMQEAPSPEDIAEEANNVTTQKDDSSKEEDDKFDEIFGEVV